MMWIPAFILGLLLLVLVGRVLFKPDNSKSAQLMKQYKHMTRELLDGTADEDLATAVASNLLAKAEGSRKDAYSLIPTLGEERCAAYSIWLWMRELEKGDAESLRASGQFGFSELAADGLDSLGLTELAAALRDYLQTADDTLVDTMKRDIAEQDVPAKLAAYIRDHADAFCDE
ncbi:MAG: hypothetical protein IKV35_02150 [Clostridia bacterium]|nr:hypothetical protein [Clostridia bacterium]